MTILDSGLLFWATLYTALPFGVLNVVIIIFSASCNILLEILLIQIYIGSLFPTTRTFTMVKKRHKPERQIRYVTVYTLYIWWRIVSRLV